MDLLRQMTANRKMNGLTSQKEAVSVKSDKEKIIEDKPSKKIVKKYFEDLVETLIEEDD